MSAATYEKQSCLQERSSVGDQKQNSRRYASMSVELVGITVFI